jgi:Zn-dependent protease
MRSFWYNIKKYFDFDQTEIRDLAVSIIVIGFIFSFKDWGGDKFDLMTGLLNLLNASLIVGLAFIVHETAHKVFAIGKGYNARYRMWLPGLGIALLITIMSNGEWIFLAPGAILISTLPLHRVGYYKPYMTYKDNALISFMGPFANIVLALIFKSIGGLDLVNPNLIYMAMTINVWLAIFNMLPIPPLDGSKVFFGSRLFYLFSAAFVVAASISMFTMTIVPCIISSLAIGLVALGAGYFFLEKS